ncbi:hypothetical protein [Arthrobacter sp. K5]|uniref:Uncharacterized protein n=1 Tax=Arthrobacter sp. K5 TaxID=2839623 RepID=A0AAU8EW85_9MICC
MALSKDYQVQRDRTLARTSFDSQKSVARARAEFDDWPAFTEAWANLTAWTTPATPGVQVSGGSHVQHWHGQLGFGS